MVHGLNCSSAHGLRLDKGSNPCLLYCQEDFFFFFFFTTEPSRKPPGNLFFTEGWEIQDQAVVGLVASGSQLPGSEMAIIAVHLHMVEGVSAK